MRMKPVIAVAMGDPAGIGPELIVKVLADVGLRDRCRAFVIGDWQVMRDTAAALGSPLRFEPVDSLAYARFEPHCIDVIKPPALYWATIFRRKFILSSAKLRRAMWNSLTSSPCKGRSMAWLWRR